LLMGVLSFGTTLSCQILKCNLLGTIWMHRFSLLTHYYYRISW
jgi:hypothetical protein